MKKNIILLLTLIMSSSIGAQVGIGTETPNQKSILDVKSNTKGFLMPRMTTIEKQTLLTDGTTDTEALGMRVFDKDKKTFWYWDGDKWVEDANNSSLKSDSPWFKDDGLGLPAKTGDKEIYFNGTVELGDGTNVIKGNLSTAQGIDNSVDGNYSAAIGENNTLKGNNSLSAGLNNSVLADYSLASGKNNTIPATGYGSIASGENNISSNKFSITQGINNNALSPFSYLVGVGNETSAFGSIAFGRFNAITDGNPLNTVPTDPIFQIGNGDTPFSRSNVFTLLKNGNLALGVIGLTGEAAKPKERLDIGTGKVRIREINTVTGTSTDKIVVAGTDGVLKTIDQTAGATLNNTSAIRTVSSGSAIAQASDYSIIVDANVALPNAASNKGKIYIFIRNGPGPFTVDASSSGKIRSSELILENIVISNNGDVNGFRVQSDGVTWRKLP